MYMYEPRLSCNGMSGNHWYYSDNPFYQAGCGLPNCTCYAWGRFAEVLGSIPTLPLGNAEDWWNTAKCQGIYEMGQEPRLGAIIVFKDGPYSGYGHVAVVEKIEGDTITFSNSAWRGSYFYLTKGTKDNNYGYHCDYKFLGFIYNPAVSSGKWEYETTTKWWYREADGSCYYNTWVKIDGNWYYFDNDGYMATGWQKLNGAWFYLGTSGVMATGWNAIGGYWYFFYGSGQMATGWTQLGCSWYYFYDSGHMAQSETTPDGYYVGVDGVWDGNPPKCD